MGNTVSAGTIFTTPEISAEVEESLNQIIQAFNHEFLVTSRRSKTNRQLQAIQSNVSTQNSEPIKLSHTRSHSADGYQPGEYNRTPQIKLSNIKRQWQCQLCHTKNESDVLICIECGSNKINVYIPIIARMETDQRERNSSAISSSSAPVRPSQRKNRNEPTIEDEKVHRRSVFVAHKRESDERIVLAHVETIRRTCLKTHSRFKDGNFPASPKSLYINGISLSKHTLALLPDQQTNLRSANNQIQWLRPDQIVPEEWTDNLRTPWAVFRDPKPNDVLQGSLGDCWFITALSVLAEEPNYLMRVLITQQCNYEGIYCVRLCKDGEWTQVIVDDRLPCTSNNKLAYSQAHRKQLWVPLIEKALAKLNGSYESIIAGRCCEGLSTVTGSPCETLILGRGNNPDDKNIDQDYLWTKLLHARSQRFLMCAMCSNNRIDKNEFEKYGLLNIHAYSLQDVKQTNDGRYRLVKLRNPWGGTYRWTGDWSDNSRLWLENPDLRSELLNERRNKRDGVFWMPFASFVKYFECVDICKLRHNWYEVRDSANFYPAPKMMQAYYLTISNPTELDITLHRKISKNLRIQRSDVSLCIAIINMEEQSNGNYRIYSIPIVSPRGQHKFISTDGQLQPGVYVILPFLFNPINKYMDNTEFTIAIHSSHVIDLERIKMPLRIEREFLIKFCIFLGEPVRVANNSDKNEIQSDGVTVYELKKYFWDGLILLVENRHSTQFVHFHFRCTVSHNTLISRKDSYRELFDVIPPNHRQIIVTISRKSPSQSFTIGHDFQYSLSSQPHIKYGEGMGQRHWPQIDESQSSDDIHLPQSISTARHT